jgi:dCMP deaminase
MNAEIKSKISWDMHYMFQAFAASLRSKDPSTKVGAAICSVDSQPISVGYNGLPQEVPVLKPMMDDRRLRLMVTLHAEINALHFAAKSVSGGSIYVWPFPPCAQCAANLVQRNIRQVISIQATSEATERYAEDWEVADWLYKKRGVVKRLYQVELYHRWKAIEPMLVALSESTPPPKVCQLSVK